MRILWQGIILIFIFSCNNNTEQELIQEPQTEVQSNPNEAPPQDMKAQPPAENPYKASKIEVKTFRDSLGFGYDIFIDGNQYVHQPHVPAVPGNKGFSDESRAKKTGELVAYKIRNNIMPPSVTPEELDSLGVLK